MLICFETPHSSCFFIGVFLAVQGLLKAMVVV